MSIVPVTGVQLLTSVMFQIYPVPAAIPLNIPVVFVTPLKVYDRGAVPPPPVRLTVAVPPLHNTGTVTAADPVIIAGSVTGSVPVTGPHPFASVMLHGYPAPAAIPLNIPVVFVTPLNVYDKGVVPPLPVRVTVPVPPLHKIAVVIDAEPVSAAGSVTPSVPVKGPQLFASVMLHE